MKSLIIIFLILGIPSILLAQQSGDEARLMRNQDVVDMLSSGVGEAIIIAKIKNASTQFDTSTTAIKTLKEAGASDALIVSMIEAKAKDQSLNTAQMPAPMKEAVGKNAVYVESNDEEIRLEALKQLRKKKFQIVDDPKQAELVFDLTVRSESAITYQPNIFFGGGVARSTEKRACNLTVYLKSADGRRILFAKDARSIYEESRLGFLGGYLPSLKMQIQLLINTYKKEVDRAKKDH